VLVRPKQTHQGLLQKVSKINADIGCEDTVMAIINFENGAAGNLELCWALPRIRLWASIPTLEVVGFWWANVNIIMDQGRS
jgi:hypothetical protein